MDDVTYGYDAANRLTTVTDWDSNVTTYTYDDADRMTLVELPNGVESAYTYDDADRLTDIEHVLGMDTLAFVNYTLDAVGNRTERVDGQGTHSYAYDDVYRLIEVTYPGPSTTSYVYDGFGNRTEMTVGVDTTTYAYDDADRLVSVDPPAASPVAYTWDDNGNLTDRGADEFVWDFEDRLVEATVDSVTTTFEYRGDGLRDSRMVGMTTTTFTWDIAGGIPVVLDDETARYVYGPSGLIAQKTSMDDFYYLADGLGSTMAITDDIGDVVSDYTYDVYGQVTGGSGATPNEFDFAGQQSDDSTGLQYLRARYYDTETGIFISRDPLASGPGWLGGPYGYVDANPTNLVDPLGLWGFKCGICNDVVNTVAGGASAAAGTVANVATAGAATAGAAISAVASAATSAAACVTDVHCSAKVAAALDAIALTLDTISAIIVDATTLAACATTGPIGCLIGYGVSTIAVQVLLLPSGAISVVATGVGCIGLLAGREKDGGGATKANTIKCGTSVLVTGAGLVIPDANVNAVLAGYTVCRDVGECPP